MTDIQSFIPEAEDGYTLRYVIYACLTLLFYDTLLTLPREISIVWTARFSITKLLFFLNRYGILASYMIYSSNFWLFRLQTRSSLSCFLGTLMGEIFTVILVTLVGSGLSLLRIYALYKRSRFVVITVTFLLIAQVITGLIVAIWGGIGAQIIFVESLGTCSVVEGWPYTWIAWIPMVVFDSTVFALTCLKTWEHVRANLRTPLLACVLRDGILYFGVLLGVEFISLMCFVYLKGVLMGSGIYLTNSIPSLMVSRVFLSLRSVKTPEQWARATDLRVRDDADVQHENCHDHTEDSWDTDDEQMYE